MVNRKLKKGECNWEQTCTVTLCRWQDKRSLLSMSSMHAVEMVEVPNRNGHISKKCNVIQDYNNGMCGIDRSGQMLSYYSSVRLLDGPKKFLYLF